MIKSYQNIKIDLSRRVINQSQPIDISVSFLDGAKVEIHGGNNSDYFCVRMVDNNSNESVHMVNIQSRHWTKSNHAYYKNWGIEVYDSKRQIFKHDFNPSGQRVYMAIDSKALGDTIAWFPYIEEYRKKYNCKIICSTFHNSLFEKAYPDYEFHKPGEVINNLYAMYKIGWYSEDRNNFRNKHDCRTIPLQQIGADYLGIDYKEIKPKIYTQNLKVISPPYICIGPESTAQAKHWNYPNGWQEVVNYLISSGYEVKYLGKESPELKGIKVIHGNISQIAQVLSGAKGFIGLGSGLSWMAWALNIPQVLISGFSEVWAEVNIPGRVINKEVCHGCFNNTKYAFDRNDWDWCPEKKNFECTRYILPQTVINTIKSVIPGEWR